MNRGTPCGVVDDRRDEDPYQAVADHRQGYC